MPWINKASLALLLYSTHNLWRGWPARLECAMPWPLSNLKFVRCTTLSSLFLWLKYQIYQYRGWESVLDAISMRQHQCVRILLQRFTTHTPYTMQLLGIWSSVSYNILMWPFVLFVHASSPKAHVTLYMKSWSCDHALQCKQTAGVE